VRISLNLLDLLAGLLGRKSQRRRRVDFQPGGEALETKKLQGALSSGATVFFAPLQETACSLRGQVELDRPADSSTQSPRDPGGVELARPAGDIKQVLPLWGKDVLSSPLVRGRAALSHVTSRPELPAGN
jgi:hypothetical protein